MAACRGDPRNLNFALNAFFLSLFALLAFAFSAAAQGPIGPGSIKITKVESNVVKTPEYQIVGGPSKRYELGDWLEIEVEFETTPEIILEVTFNYTVLIEGKLLEGKVTHVNISKGREHYSVMYIEPRALQRLIGGKFAGVNTAEAIWVEITRAGKALATYPMPRKPRPKLPRMAGLLRNKSQTPFAPLYWDRYEAIKVSP